MGSKFGIDEYLSASEGFFGIIKQRYSDFLVNEVDSSGAVVHLTDLSAPKAVQNVSTDQADTPVSDEISSLIGEENLLALGQLLDQSVSDVKICSQMDKGQRTQVHNFIRERYGGQLDSETSTMEDGKTIIRVYRNKGGQNRKRKRWPSDRAGQFLHFVLYKENLETQQAASIIAHKLRLKASDIKFAGSKDRRAKTTQICSIFKGDPTRLAGLNRVLSNMKLGNFHYAAEDLSLGDSGGNHFTVVLRRISGDQQSIVATLESLKTNGFINYFGSQRFGTTSVPTCLVGRAMLQNKWEDVVNLILSVKDGYDDPEVTPALKTWAETKDPSKAIQQMSPRKRETSLEGLLLKGLQKHGANNFVNAMSHMPYNSRLLYIHSYQSLIWNQVVSQRIKSHRMKVLPGDLLLDTSSDAAKVGLASVRTISAEEVDSVSPWDIVLPVPGHSVKLPENEMKDIYTTLLNQDQLSLSSFEHRIKDYSARGDYRKVFQRPTDLSWEFEHYAEDSLLSLTLSDLDVLNGVEIPKCPDGNLLALILRFSLPTSCYATMLLRELTKMDTSSGFQSTLNEKSIEADVEGLASDDVVVGE